MWEHTFSVKIGAFLDKIRSKLRDVGDIVDGAEDVVKYVRRCVFVNEYVFRIKMNHFSKCSK